MSEPEIVRRCFACGASTLEHNSVCPECGQELRTKEELRLSDGDDTISVEAHSNVTELPAAVASQSKETIEQPGSSSSPRNADAGSGDGESSGSIGDVSADFNEAESAVVPSQEQPRQRVRIYDSQRRKPGAREKIQRASVAAREIEDDMLHKVDKIRKMSTVVFDEAAYDPSVRFLLVAAVLFALFLIIVLLNNLIQ